MEDFINNYNESNLKKIWEYDYKTMVINDVIFNDTSVPYKIADCLDNNYYICVFAVQNAIIWLNSKEGIEFINQSFNLNIPIDKAISSLNENSLIDIDLSINKDIRAYRGFRKESKLVKLWNNKYKKICYNFLSPLIMEHLSTLNIHREEDIKNVYEPITIAVDTLICWINSPVGRYFIRDVYNVNVPDGIDGMPIDVYQMGLFDKEYLLDYGLTEKEIMELPQP